MTPQVKQSARETRRLQTRERILGAAIAEFKRSGMAGADVNAIVAAAGVAHGTFFFHFPSKEHVLLELEGREEARMAGEFARFLEGHHDLVGALTEVVHLVAGLEVRLGPVALQRTTRAALLADAARTRTNGPTIRSSCCSSARSSGREATEKCIPKSTRSTAPRSSSLASTAC